MPVRAQVILVGLALAGPALAEALSVTAADCTRVIQHVPGKDVEYKPGVDVNGKKVAPADLNGGYPTLAPDEITLQIGADLADRLGRAKAKQDKVTNPTAANRPLRAFTGTAPVGSVTISGNNVLWNGVSLAPQDEVALAAACRAAAAANTPPPPKPSPPAR